MVERTTQKTQGGKFLMTKEQIEELGITYVEGMTDEMVIEKITAKRKADEARITELDGKVKSHKATIDKYSSEIADYKKKEADKLTDEEKAQAHLKELEDKLAKAERSIAESKKVNAYVAMGYSKELAEKVASAELDGKDTAEYHKEFIKAHDEALKAEIMKNNPNLQGGGGSGGNEKFTKENFKAGKLKMEELNELKATNPELYKEVISG